MAIFPKIQSPCPYKSQLAAVMDGDMCRMCHRQVFDLSDMDDAGRLAFMSGCAEEVCVSYRMPLRAAAAAAALAVATLAMPMTAAAADVEATEPEYVEIIVGGIKDLSKVEYVEDTADAAIPELPVVYEQAAPAASDTKAATPAPVSSRSAP